MDRVFRTYVQCDGKKPKTAVKGKKNISSYDDVKNCQSFGAMLKEGFIDISFDTEEMSNKFWDMADENNWNCLIQTNPLNGHIHSFWKIPRGWVFKDGQDKKTAVGFVSDVHSGDTVIPMKVDGNVREFDFIPDSEVDEVPYELYPVNTQINLMGLKDGDGRNEELFKYILILQSQLSMDKESIIRVLTNTNKFIFDKPLKAKEFETITRDESFEEPIFYNGKSFLHDVFGKYMKNEFHIKRINGQLHVYDDGIYKSGYRFIESKMVEVIPTLKQNQRTETLKYLEIITPEETEPSDATLIAFKNGIYDMKTDSLIDFDPSIVITNMIPWNWNPDAYSELADHTLNRLSVNDPQIRALLEESIGYCFFRQNELSKSFILTGDGSNGKSTFLDMVKNVLSRPNYVALDMDELSERFSTSSMFGKLAVFGDDSNDDYLQGKTLSQFKKIVSGNDVKGENKGQDVFFFKPYTKLFFSFNELPRIRNKGFGAIRRRLEIIPFNAKFSKDDDDYDEYIVYKLKQQDVAEYLIQLGMAGLKRVRNQHGFTTSDKVEQEVDKFEKENNPILQFLDEVSEDEIINESTSAVYLRYETFCHDNGFIHTTRQVFTKQVEQHLKCISKERRDPTTHKRVRVYTREGL